MGDWIIEAVKFVGGIAGLASTIFLIYDRFVRGRPVIFLFPSGRGVNLVMRNVQIETLIIDEFHVTPRRTVEVANGNDIQSTIEAAVNVQSEGPVRAFAILGPEASRQFPLVFSPQFADLADSTEIVLRVSWRDTKRPLPFKIRRWGKIRIAAEDLRRLREAEV